MTNKLSPRQRKFTKALAEGKNLTQSALSAGYSPDTAAQQGSRLFKKGHIQKALATVLEEKGLSDSFFCNRLKELCLATGEKGPDFTARARGLEILGRVKGHLDPKLKVTVDESHKSGPELIASLRASIAELLPHLQAKETGKIIDVTPKGEAEGAYNKGDEA